VVELLKRPNATAALSLLEMLRAMYEPHPRPKVQGGYCTAWPFSCLGRWAFWRVLDCPCTLALRYLQLH
jgi:hypothetical protein